MTDIGLSILIGIGEIAITVSTMAQHRSSEYYREREFNAQ